MSYTLAAAARATGLSRRALVRAFKEGRIAGTRDTSGEWRVEPSELHRVYPPVAPCSSGSDPIQRSSAPDIDALGAQIEVLLRQAGDRLQGQLDAMRREHDARRQRTGEQSDA
jgi:hypothetical protein